MVGAWIIEFEQHGRDRAKYGARLLERLAEDLQASDVRGLGLTSLKMCRLFARAYPGIRQTLSDESSLPTLLPPIRQTLSDEFKAQGPAETAARNPEQLLRLSWSH